MFKIPESPEELAKLIDHTNVRAHATARDIEKLCEEAKKYGFFAVAVNPSWVELAVKLLKGTDIKVVTTAGFPLGSTLPEVKALEARKVVEQGASEIDMSINVGALKSGMYELVEEDIKAVVEAAKEGGAIVKAIIECCYLTDNEKKKACEIAVKAGVAFIKTSTGYGTYGATVEDVKLIKSVIPSNIGIKAAGGIRTFKQTMDLIRAGATRIGTSASVAIIEEAYKAFKEGLWPV